MQHVSKGSHPPPADIVMLPIIDMKPPDDHCIYSTLCFVEEPAKRLGIITPCITFDQPLWLKAVEIISATQMNMVCRDWGDFIPIHRVKWPKIGQYIDVVNFYLTCIYKNFFGTT